MNLIRYFSLVFFLLHGISVCSQGMQVGDTVILDQGVEKLAKSHMYAMSEIDGDTLGAIYYSHIIWDAFKEDSLIKSYDENDSLIGAPFKAGYYFKEDSLFIVGEFGLISGYRYGFYCIYENDDLTAKHFFCDEGPPSFAHKLNDTLQSCILVDCLSSELVLTHRPKNNPNNGPLYGSITFMTDDHYIREGEEVFRTKSRMKIYFKARYITLK